MLSFYTYYIYPSFRSSRCDNRKQNILEYNAYPEVSGFEKKMSKPRSLPLILMRMGFLIWYRSLGRMVVIIATKLKEEQSVLFVSSYDRPKPTKSKTVQLRSKRRATPTR